MYHGHVAALGEKEVLDEVLLVAMPAPYSYTKEDVIEIQAHAGAVVLKKILELVLSRGARLAEPGEFTRRAFINGRIDLSQAEAVIDVIQAKTETALKMASRQLEGTIGNTAKGIKERLLEINAMMEAEIEFPEEVEPNEDPAALYLEKTKEIQASLAELLEGYRRGHLMREGLRLIILGKVNVGKSSLLNRFLKRERAIVTEYPGTTRDSIEETLDIAGLPVVLVDTAGWRNTTDPVERLGIDRTRELTESADLILFMVDAGKGILSEDEEIYERIRNKDKSLVVNKTDLLKRAHRISIPDDWDFFDIQYTSVKFERGIDSLLNSIYRFGTEGGSIQESMIVPTLRQHKLFEKAYNAVCAARRGLEQNLSLELTAIDFKEAMDAVDDVTGASVKTDVLDAVFSRFCIGK